MFNFLAFGYLIKATAIDYNGEIPSGYASGFTKNVVPIPCHSHNGISLFVQSR